MTEESGGKIHIDSDWKEEAAQEKKRLEEMEAKQKQESAAPGTPGGEAASNFMELINLLAMQAVIGLGGFQGQGGENMPPNPTAARHYIDLLEMLKTKTTGNLNDDEKQAIDSVLQELRMQFVQAMKAPSPEKTEKT